MLNIQGLGVHMMKWVVYWIDEPIARFKIEIDADQFCENQQDNGYDCHVEEDEESNV